MYKIKLMNPISKIGLDKFDHQYEVALDLEQEDAILVRSASLHDYEVPASLKAIARAGAGVNNIPIDQCSEKGIVVFNTPGANANAVKELVLCSLFLSSRKIVEGLKWVESQKDNSDVEKAAEKQKAAYVGPEIDGKKLGIIGLGAIGVAVANSAMELGMDVMGYDPYLSLSAAWGLSKGVKNAKTLDMIFNECDYISLHVPVTPDTKGFINETTLSKMKDGVRILNFARGDLVDNNALIQAMQAGKVAKYISDFASQELIGLDNVLLLPHLGASTPESEDNCAKMAVQEVRDYLENGNIKNSVNFPEVVEPRMSKVRICIVNKNIPNILAKISSTCANQNMNIENMVNKAKGEFAYTLLDINEDVDDQTIQQIQDIDGIINVRVIKD